MTKKILEKLKNELNLSHFDVDLKYQDKEKGYTEIVVQLDYLSACIYLSQNIEKYEYISVITHELCHIITEPLYRFGIDGATNTNTKYLEKEREQATEHIARIFLKYNLKRIKKELGL